MRSYRKFKSMHMKKFFALAIGLIALGAAAQSHAFMSYNIRNGIGMDRVRSLERVAEVINARTPEIVAIQEVDSVTGRSGGTFVMSELGSLTGMYHTFAPAIDYDGGRYGIGMLSAKEPLRVTRYALPGREEARALLVAEFDDYVFACTHLSLTMEDCLASVQILKDVAAKSSKPFFIAGDFNARPDSEVIKTLGEYFRILSDTDVLTFPADVPDRTLDYIMYYNPDGAPAIVTDFEVIEATMPSDHRPLLLQVEY